MKLRSKWNRFRAWLLLPIPAVFLMAGAPAFAGGGVGVSLNVNLGPPPAFVYPPDLVLIPGTEIYFAPVGGVDIFFYDGYWWSHQGPRWYRAYSPDGPWVVIGPRYVPGPLYRVPYNYRIVYRHGHRIPFGHWERISHRDGRWGGHDRRDRHEHRGDDHGRHGRDRW